MSMSRPVLVLNVLNVLSLVLSATAAAAQTTADPPKGFDDEGLPRVVVSPTERRRDRVAVPSLKCKAPPKICEAVEAQLRKNLEISTFFEILDPKTYVANMDQETLDPVTGTKWTDWFNIGARYLVKGEIGAGVDLQLRFYDVLERKPVTVNAAAQSHTGVGEKGVHGAVDAFLNAVIGEVTGTPGIFGSRIFYATKTSKDTRGIGAMDMDGHGAGGVVAGDTISNFPNPGPGGVLYLSFRDGKPDLWLGNKKLTHDAYQYRSGTFGPGGQIAASLSMGSGSDIYLLSGDGKIQKRLTNGEGDNVAPTWSPDGSQIAFVSSRSGGPQIFVMSAGGGGAKRVTMAGSYNVTPHWGPSGRIAFTAMTSSGSDIFTVDSDGNMQRITQDQGTNSDPTWSPDGRYLAFASAREGKAKRIFISSADGRWQFPVSSPGGYSALRWAK